MKNNHKEVREAEDNGQNHGDAENPNVLEINSNAQQEEPNRYFEEARAEDIEQLTPKPPL